MTLIEKAFMVDLIKKNYRRRTAWLILKIILMLAGISMLIIVKVTGNNDFFIPGFAFILFSIFFMMFAKQPMGLDTLSPKGIKKAQAKALDEFTKIDFEELICSVPLKEYFEIEIN